MMDSCRAWGWIFWKDVTTELRGKQTWCGMLLLGVLLVVLVDLQLDVPTEMKSRIVSGLFWLDVFFAGILALDRSLASEREEGALRLLMLAPHHPGFVYLAKVAVIFVALTVMELVLLMAFMVFANVSLVGRPLPLMVLLLAGNLGFAAVGVLLSALTTSLNQRGGLLALLLLPLIVPVLLGAAEGTRLLLAGAADAAFWGWTQLLALFAFLFGVIGFNSFGWIVEEG